MGAPRWLMDAAAMIRENPSEVTVAEVASAVDADAAYLARLFRRHFACTPGDYIRRLRVACARELLAHSEMTLAEIAVRSGFADQAHLTRVFKRETGMTPAAARHHSITRS